MTARYVIRPKADQDLNDQAYYLATQANPRVGHNFLLAAHETFSLLATQPNMGWHSRLKNPDSAKPQAVLAMRQPAPAMISHPFS